MLDSSSPGALYFTHPHGVFINSKRSIQSCIMCFNSCSFKRCPIKKKIMVAILLLVLNMALCIVGSQESFVEWEKEGMCDNICWRAEEAKWVSQFSCKGYINTYHSNLFIFKKERKYWWCKIADNNNRNNNVYLTLPCALSLNQYIVDFDKFKSSSHQATRLRRLPLVEV